VERAGWERQARERNRIRYKENLKREKNKRRGNIYGSRISRAPHPAAYARSEFIYHHQHLTTGDISCSALVPTATLSSPPFPSPPTLRCSSDTPRTVQRRRWRRQRAFFFASSAPQTPAKAVVFKRSIRTMYGRLIYI